jgi:isoquinoline 1-oxidoreductase subunit alpha
MQVAALLHQKPTPTADQIINKMDDVVCRCGTYLRMKKGIQTAVQMTRKEGKKS